MKVDAENDKEVLAVRDVQISLHKEQHPDDTASGDEIGLSSEDEADEMSEDDQIGRKYKRRAPPPPAPDEPVPPAPAQPDHQPQSIPQAGSTSGLASIQVPVSMLQQVHSALGQLLQGQPPQLPPLGGAPSADPEPSSGVPFPVPKTSRFNKTCQICQRDFWSPETYRRHLKTHLGTQHNICPNPGCGRKLSSKRSLDKHLTTCQVPKTVFCPKKGCKSTFATKEVLQLHMPTNKGPEKVSVQLFWLWQGRLHQSLELKGSLEVLP